jgi:heat shock protein HslJ
MKKPILALFVMLILTACSGGGGASVTGTWKLISYNQTPAVPDVETSIEFKDGQVSGNVGCNGFGGEYAVDGDQITFDKMMSTLMACTDPIGTQESVTFAVMSGTASFNLEGNQLTITSADGSSVIVLEKK